MYNISFKNAAGEIEKHEQIPEHLWRFIRVMCEKNEWEIILSERVK